LASENSVIGIKSVHTLTIQFGFAFHKVLPMKMLLRTLWPLDDCREILVDRYPFVIGRRSDNDCILALAFVSRRHCQFTWIDGQVHVQDLESYNGTFVNGKRATSPLPVVHGDEVTLGPCSFRVIGVNDGGETPASVKAATSEERAAGTPEELDSTIRATNRSDVGLSPGGARG
jgi:pSer/pThr/pTyr-binding forkhead associated (FHA) protein